MESAISSIKTNGRRKTRFAICSLIIIGSFGKLALALDPMGPPAAGLEEGQARVGIDYSYSKMDVELSDGTWIEFLDGAFLDAGEATSFTLKDFKANKAYVNLGYGFAYNCEAFLRVGGTNSEFGDSLWEDGEEFDSDSELAVGGGIRATFLEEGGLKLGALLQASWAEYHGMLDAPLWAAPDFVELEIAEVQLAVGASYTWEDRISVYGGPFFHFISGELEDTISEIDEISGGLLNSVYVWDVDEDSVFGGYLGAQVEVTEGCSFNVEYQRTAAADAFGASVMWRF
jgi:hypothetical protein